MSETNLMTSCLFHGQEFLVKMSSVDNFLEMSLTDKQSGEEWQCGYDSAYIENLTQKTGNFKQFYIFVSMLKSGLLKTSEAISLDLFTLDELESLRVRRLKNQLSRSSLINCKNSNRRYLIVIYNVEFDRILYPLPLEYCGYPDPKIMQTTIKKLEAELARSKKTLEEQTDHNKYVAEINYLRQRIDDLEIDNQSLKDELCRLKNSSRNSTNTCQNKTQIKNLQNAILNLEKMVVAERQTHHKLVEKMRNEKFDLLKEIELRRNNEINYKNQLNQHKNNTNRKFQTVSTKSRDEELQIIYQRDNERSRLRTRSWSPRNQSPSPNRTRSEPFWNSRQNKLKRHQLVTQPTSPKVQNLLSSRSPSPISVKNRKEKNTNLKANSSRNERTKIYENKRPLKTFSPIRTAAIHKSRRDLSDTSSRSRNSSVESHKNSTQSKYSDSSRALKMRMRSSEEEFKTLETRINALQQLLKENTNMY